LPVNLQSELSKFIITYTYGSERMNEILSPLVAGVGRSKCMEIQVQRALDSAQRGVHEAAEKSISEDGYGLPKYNHHPEAPRSSELISGKLFGH
jgi:hypothetical protein